MFKRKKGRKLHRERDQRKALKKSLVKALFFYNKIKTTKAKAKEIKPLAEKLITKAKNPNLANIRYLSSYLSKEVAKKLVKEIALRYKERRGGYTRIIALGKRKTDAAEIAIIELV